MIIMSIRERFYKFLLNLLRNMNAIDEYSDGTVHRMVLAKIILPEGGGLMKVFNSQSDALEAGCRLEDLEEIEMKVVTSAGIALYHIAEDYSRPEYIWWNKKRYRIIDARTGEALSPAFESKEDAIEEAKKLCKYGK